ncbi:hypothetical protein NMY22_g1161 [Coprinellus aureogranulatus]|nr:hypothetical protein NMY22_g1161 [Coprinellus aureogranulatus]
MAQDLSDIRQSPPRSKTLPDTVTVDGEVNPPDARSGSIPPRGDPRSKTFPEISALLANRNAVKYSIRLYKGGLPPILRIPVEILNEIFLLCLPNTRYPSLRFSEAPLLLTRVCRLWKAVALGCAQLWTKVHIVTNKYDMRLRHTVRDSPQQKAIAERQLAMLQLYVSGAKALPLRLSLKDKSTYKPFCPSPVIAFVGSLFPRLQAIFWNSIHGPGFDEFIASHPAQSFPLLEEVRIQRSLLNNTSLLDAQFRYWRAPKLCGVEIRNYVGRSLNLPLRWPHLTRLAFPGKAFWVRGFQGTSCGVLGAHFSTVANSIHLLSLRSLDVTYQGCIGDLLRQLYIPQLTEVVLKGDSDGCLKMLIAHNSACLEHIESLTLRSSAYYPSAIVKYLERLPNLRTFILADSESHSYPSSTPKAQRKEFDQALLLRMSPAPQSLGALPTSSSTQTLPCLCPLLERFEFREGDNYLMNRHLNARTVVRFIGRKWKASKEHPGQVAALKHITLPTANFPDTYFSAMQILKWWREKGLTMEIAHPGLDLQPGPGQYDEPWDEPYADLVSW